VRRLVRPLFFAGILAIVFGLAKAHAAYVADDAYDFTGSSRFAWTVLYGVLLVVGSYAAGLPDLPRTRRQAVVAAVVGPSMAAVAISVVQLVTGDALLPRFVVFGSVALVVPWALICVLVSRGGELRAQSRDRVVLVADPAEAVALGDELEGQPERAAVLLNHLTLAMARGAGSGSRSPRPLEALVTNIRANLVVLDRAALADPQVVAQVAELHGAGVRVRTLSAFYDEWLGKLPLSELERTSLLFDIREVHGGRYLRVKRVMDLAICLPGVVAVVLLVPFVVVGNLLGNRGPLLYRQERVGKNGRVFTILKFRTMVDAPPGEVSTWTQDRDPRVTTFGRVLRKTHLDELPQVLNILRGELSVVGPRPEQPRYVAELADKLPFYDLRHSVQPGLTGWAQVKYGYAGDERDALEKLQYDFWYLRNQGLRLDLRIIGRTFRSVAGSSAGGR
jgi:lipopolysaccharide/colanic/teichoic acid biosynthesis glycosyltransferase